ncbi:MAG: Holliday junction resolvase RuvX [Oscillospiraceae bacterium]|nr:Holliday junction resolvase RuvX [Oscillospiraceae bacterium]
MSRIMAIDYGDARTGVAVSDITQTITGDTWVIKSKNKQETARLITDEAIKRGVSCIVVGYPKNMDGSIGSRAKKSEQLVTALQSLCEIEIKLWDERLTTISAHKVLDTAGKYGKKRKEAVDAVAASLILEGYLRQ